MPHDVTQKRNTGNVGTADSSPPPTINHRMRTAMVLFELEQALGRYVADIAANPEDIPESMRQEVLNRKHGPQGAQAPKRGNVKHLIQETYISELIDIALKISQHRTDCQHLEALKRMAESLGIFEIRNAVCHPNRPFPECYWHRMAAIATDPSVEALQMKSVIFALRAAMEDRITPPPEDWLTQPTWAVPNTLPGTFDHEITGLIGRQEEAKQLLKYLKNPRFPFLAITGPGGCGKTALCLEVLRDCCYEPSSLTWTDEVIYVTAKTEQLTVSGVQVITDPVDSLDRVRLALVDALRVANDLPDGVAFEIALDTLRDRRVLVCLDNLETLLRDHSPAFEGFLADLPPAWRVLVTSRVIVNSATVLSIGPMNEQGAKRLARDYLVKRGGERLSEETLAHTSGFALVERFVGANERLEALTRIGEYALEAAAAVMVYKLAKPETRAKEMDTKIGLICTSNRLMWELHGRGMCRAIVGKGMLGGQGGNERGALRICYSVATRLVGHLFMTRPWERFLEVLDPLINVAANFPFTNYDETNAKSVLQHTTQALFGAVPVYEVIKEEGPDHNKSFTVLAWGGKKGQKRLGVGTGKNRKEAEKAAALASLLMLPRVEQAQKKTPAEEFPDWLRTRCDNVGTEVIRRLCGVELPRVVRDAVLVPGDRGQFTTNLLRWKLVVVGGRVRQLLAFRHAIMNRATCSEATELVSYLNKNANLCQIISGTPLGEWIDSLRRMGICQDADKGGPLIDTLNSVIGALTMCYGLGACRPIEAMLFSGRTEPAVVSPRSKLQQVVQQRVKNRYEDVVKFESRFLNAPNEVHKARIEVTVFVAGVMLGRDVAGNKTDATQAACQQALNDSRLEDVLAQLTPSG